MHCLNETRSLRATILLGTLLLAVSLVTTNQLVAQQENSVESMVNQLPSSANVVMLIDVNGIQNSAIGQTQAWQDAIKVQYESGLGMMLRTSKTAVTAARVNPRWPEPLWRAALMAENSEGVFAGLHKSFAGHSDEHIGFNFLEMQDDTYVAIPKPGMTAVFSPLERQQFFGWLKHLKSPVGWVSESYLDSAVQQFTSPNYQVVIGAQLDHSYSPRIILDEVRNSELLKQNNIDAKRFATLVSSIEGFTIATSFTDSIQGKVQLKFKEDISELKSVAKDIAFDLLDDSNVGIAGTDKWQVKVEKNSIQLEGPLSINTFRLMVSELDMISDVPVWATQSEATMQPSIVTREYFNSVNRMMDDLRVHQSTNVNFASNAKLMLRYARRIRQLPTALVDENVVDFADDAIEMLVESATELRNTSEKNKTERAGVRTRRARAGTDDFGIISMGSRATRSRYGRFGRFSSGSGGTGKYERNQVSQKNAEGVWRIINQKFAEFEKASLALQRKLENKYDMDF